MPSWSVRALAAIGFLASLALAWFPFFLTLLSVFTAAQRPDPEVPDGDPCCGHPDTWGEVVEGLTFGALTGAVTLGLFAAACVCAATAALGRVPARVRGRPARRLAGAWAVVLVIALAFFFGVL